MNRITTGIVLALAAAFLMGCGGSSAPAPEGPDNNGNGGNNNPNFLDVAAPQSITGDHSVTTVPGQLNVETGATEAQFTAIADKFGYEVLKFDEGHATVQVPVGGETVAADLLEKEFTVISAEPVQRINTPKINYSNLTEFQKSVSIYPGDPFYSDRPISLDTDGTNFGLFNEIGQGQPMNFQGFPTAWDIAMNPGPANAQVSVAIIDAGFFDYTINPRGDFNAALLDAAASGSIDGAGNFTAGFAAATWELDDDGDMTTRDFPWRNTGELMLGILAADHNTFRPFGIDLDGSATIDPDEIWNEGMAGVNPGEDENGNFTGAVSYILIKTGSLNVDTWSFTDNEIAASIDHAVASGANIILLGMFGNAAPSAVVTTAIANARNSDVLVIAPAGDVVESFNGTGFDNAPVDITVNPVTPGSDLGVLSVAGTGLNKVDPTTLPPLGGGEANPGNGWSPLINAPFNDDIYGVASLWSNTGASMAAVGFSMGFSWEPYLINGDGVVDPVVMVPGENYALTIDRFGTSGAAAYVAGAASQVFQTLTFANGGTPPNDDDVQAELLAAAGAPIPGTLQGGILNAGLAMASAINGGSLVSVEPALQFTAPGGNTANWLSQPADAVTRGTDISINPTVINGTAPFTLTVTWGEGKPDAVVNNWNSGDIVTLVGGYDLLGVHAIGVTVEDSNGLTASAIIVFQVINPLAATITVETATGATASPAALKAGTAYRFKANPANVYTGNGNVTTYSWDFNGDSTEDATGPSPVFTFPSAGNNTVTLTITETLRPDTVRTLDVTVIP
jgi:hypothetical protein